MGKRSNFTRRKSDAYQTIDHNAVAALMPHIDLGEIGFAEPCCGDGKLVAELEKSGMVCEYANDILFGIDALTVHKFEGADVIITNPPWTRQLLHPLILHFSSVLPTWLLFDADWAYNKASAIYLDHCSDIVAVGRLRWIEGTSMTGKDNVSWYRFDARWSGGPKFHGRR